MIKNFTGRTAAEKERKAYRAGQFFRAAAGVESAKRWCQRNGVRLQAAHEEGVNTKGGYLVPSELDEEIISLRNEYGVFRKYAKNVTMSSDIKNRPRRTGGLTAYFPGESGVITESNKSWDTVKLVAKSIGVLARISNELYGDAITDIADDIVAEIAQAFAKKEDECGFNGDGTSTYGGIVGACEKLGSAGINQFDSGYAYSNIEVVDITDTMALLPTYARKNAKWYMNPGVYSQFESLKATAGGNTILTLEAGTVPAFLGYPVILTEAMPSTAEANQICALFGDLSQAADFGDRAGTSIAISDSAVVDGESVFERNQLAIRGTSRFDINVHDAGDSSNAGPIVGLKTHSS